MNKLDKVCSCRKAGRKGGLIGGAVLVYKSSVKGSICPVPNECTNLCLTFIVGMVSELTYGTTRGRNRTCFRTQLPSWSYGLHRTVALSRMLINNQFFTRRLTVRPKDIRKAANGHRRV